MKFRGVALFLYLVSGMFLLVPALLGQTWVGGSGVWSAPANWCGGLPNGGSVSIGACMVPPPSHVTQDVNSTINDLTVDSGNSLTILGPHLLAVNGTSLSNSGTVALSGGATIALGAST